MLKKIFKWFIKLNMDIRQKGYEWGYKWGAKTGTHDKVEDFQKQLKKVNKEREKTRYEIDKLTSRIQVFIAFLHDVFNFVFITLAFAFWFDKIDTWFKWVVFYFMFHTYAIQFEFLKERIKVLWDVDLVEVLKNTFKRKPKKSFYMSPSQKK